MGSQPQSTWLRFVLWSQHSTVILELSAAASDLSCALECGLIGLQVVRGLTDLTADQMVAFSDRYGITERALDAPRLKNAHPENSAILRIGGRLNRLIDAHRPNSSL